jgi:predicted dehydrogenase
VAGGTENMAFLTLFFDGNQIAHVHVNWLAPVKVRRTLIGASSKMIVYDDLEQSEKIKVYDKGITLNRHRDPAEKLYQVLVGYRTGDMLAPHLDMTEALRVEAAHFVACIEGRRQPLTDGQAGLHVVRVLEAATESMGNRGRPVELPAAVLS